MHNSVFITLSFSLSTRIENAIAAFDGEISVSLMSSMVQLLPYNTVLYWWWDIGIIDDLNGSVTAV